MKRSLVYRTDGKSNHYATARLGTEPDEPNEHATMARFRPAQRITNARTLVFTAGGGLKGRKVRPYTVGAHISVGGHGFVLKRGLADGVKIMPPEIIDALDALEEERRAARVEFDRRWKDLVEDGWARGKTLCLSDLPKPEPEATEGKEAP